MNRPEGYSIDVNSLHFQCDIVGEEGDSFDSRGVSDDWVPRAYEGFEANPCLGKMPVSDDDKPLIGFGLNPECWDEIGQFFEKPI